MKTDREEADKLRFVFVAVFLAELLKLVTCIGLVLLEEGTFLRFKASLHNAIIKNKVDTVGFRYHFKSNN